MKRLKNWLAALLLVCCCSQVGTRTSGIEIRAAGEIAATQDLASLDRRISMLEQRFYFVEATVRRLEQQVTMRPTPPLNQRSAETEGLLHEVERLKAQLNVIGCGLAKLDERTLPANLRQSGREDNRSYKDPCRMNPETPLRLPTTP